MNFNKAFAALESGKKIKRTDWSFHPKSYIKIHDWYGQPTAYMHEITCDYPQLYNFSVACIKSESWEIVIADESGW